MAIAILNLGNGGRGIDEQSDVEIGKRSHFYDHEGRVLDAADLDEQTRRLIDHRVWADVPLDASEEEIGRALRAAAARES